MCFRLALWILLSLSSFILAQDTIYMKNGETRNCSVSKETLKECFFKFQGVELKLNWSDISRIEYGEIPEEYTEAEAARSKGDYANARKLYGDVLKSKEKEYELWKDKATYGVALNFMQEGPTKSDSERYYTAADQQFQEIIKLGENSRFYGDALVGLVELKILQKQYDEAIKSAKKLGDLRLSSYWNLKADLYQCNIDFLKGDYKNAARRYDTLANRARKESDLIYALSLLGKGRSEKNAGDNRKAEEVFLEVIEKSTEIEALAGSWNGMGDIYWESGDFKNALKAYLRTVVLYPEIRQELPRALYFAGQCFIKLKDTHESWRSRGQQLLDQQKTEFPQWKP